MPMSFVQPDHLNHGNYTQIICELILDGSSENGVRKIISIYIILIPFSISRAVIWVVHFDHSASIRWLIR